MSKVPADLKYTEDNLWLRTEANGVIAVGITEFMIGTMGDITFAQLPQAGKTCAAGDAVGYLEGIMRVTDLRTPVAGEIIEVNGEIIDDPEELNEDFYGNWIYKIKPATPASTVNLLDATAYTNLVG